MDTQQEISAFLDAMCEHFETKQDQNIQSGAIQKLEEDLENSRISSKNLNKTLSQHLRKDESNITTKYVEIQERNNSYLKNIKTFEEKLEQMKIGIEQEKQQIFTDAEINLKREEKLWKKKIEEINNQKQKRKLDHTKKKEKFSNDLTTAQLTNDLELDEMETKLRRELINLNGKIWRQKEIDADMKKQIEELKKQKKTSTTINIYQDDLRLLMDDIEDFFKDNAALKPPQPPSTSSAMQKPNTNTHARMYNSNYQPLDIKHTPKTYNNNLAEILDPNQFEWTHNNFDNYENKPPQTADIYSRQENPTTTDNKWENFDSNRNMSNPVQFTSLQTNKLDENRTMQNQSPNQQTLKQNPDFYNLDLPNLNKEKIVKNKSVRKKVSETDKGQKKNIGSNKRNVNQVSKNKDSDDGTGVVQKKQTKKKGRPIKKVESEIKDTVLEQKPVPKKRKMFDPNNYDYLDEMMANYTKDE